ncbi:MAG: ABC-2 family transporter protein [Spirochaetaceae bacterium]|jgi:ABC-2 type transport system permease protein|nr:ABC-2 family transporter protein [Spirochaetaceae bacterium]
MKLKKLTKLYFKYVAQYLKSLMAYRVDFFTGLIGFSFLQITGVIFITLVFNSIPSLQGWNFYEILFIYGFAQLPRGLDHIFTDNLWLISSWLIADGDFDRYLLRPINPLFQVIAERFQMDGFGEFVIGVILVVIASINLSINYTVDKFAVLILTSISGALIITSLKMIIASIAFWTKRSGGLLQTVYSFNEFCYYPVTIYNKALQFVLTFILPFALTSYFPATYILGKQNLIWALAVPVGVSILFILFSYRLWCSGINHYESAGS